MLFLVNIANSELQCNSPDPSFRVLRSFENEVALKSFLSTIKATQANLYVVAENTWKLIPVNATKLGGDEETIVNGIVEAETEKMEKKIEAFNDRLKSYGITPGESAEKSIKFKTPKNDCLPPMLETATSTAATPTAAAPTTGTPEAASEMMKFDSNEEKYATCCIINKGDVAVFKVLATFETVEEANEYLQDTFDLHKHFELFVVDMRQWINTKSAQSVQGRYRDEKLEGLMTYHKEEKKKTKRFRRKMQSLGIKPTTFEVDEKEVTRTDLEVEERVLVSSKEKP